jgi:hypothetical protein
VKKDNARFKLSAETEEDKYNDIGIKANNKNIYFPIGTTLIPK